MMRTRSMVGLPAAKASLLLRNRLLPSLRLNLKLRNRQPSAGPPCRRACIHSTLHPAMGARVRVKHAPPVPLVEGHGELDAAVGRGAEQPRAEEVVQP